MDLYRVRSRLSAALLTIPGEVGWQLQQLVERMPVTRPGWFLLKPVEGVDVPEVVAYQDGRGRWWEYMPGTGKLHNIPWLETFFHYEDRSGYSRLPLTDLEAKRLVSQGLGRRPDDPFTIAHRNDLTARDLRTVMP